MKKTILLATFALLLTFVSKAQFEVGQKVINGGISLSTSKSTSTTNSTQTFFGFGLNSSFGKFITPNHLIGFGINYTNSSQHQESPPNLYKTNSNQIGLNYFSTYYHPLAKNFYWFITWSASGNYSFNSYNTTLSSVETIQKTNGFGVGIATTPGISYKLNKRILLNATLNNILVASFTSTRTTYSNSSQVDKYNSFGLSSSLNNINLGNIGIGFSILLNKK
ncbi:MAG: hypothetical protein KGL19_12230, partial [Bacteroidota bacterium]|nr:hypothetical protein [Bacteroidota bacterium]